MINKEVKIYTGCNHLSEEYRTMLSRSSSAPTAVAVAVTATALMFESKRLYNGLDTNGNMDIEEVRDDLTKIYTTLVFNHADLVNMNAGALLAEAKVNLDRMYPVVDEGTLWFGESYLSLFNYSDAQTSTDLVKLIDKNGLAANNIFKAVRLYYGKEAESIASYDDAVMITKKQG